MPETYLSLILKASKTGTGVTDATREMKDFEKSIESVRRTEAQAAAQHLRTAESLKSNAGIANVTRQSFAGLEKELQAGSLSVAGFQAATQQAGVSAGLISQAALNASSSIGKLNTDYTTGKINAEQYTQGLRGIQAELQNSQSFMERYGAAVKTVAVVSLAALAMGFADVSKTAMDFEKSMSVIVGLTNTTKEQLGGLTDAVLKMGPALGKSPKELAEGLYFISSSGYQGAEALKILEASAKASAAGLGETKTISDSVTSALKAYGEGADQASRYTDMFIQIVKEGKGEPAELADVLGRGLPIAKAAGISFEEMGASLATMTLTGMDSAEAMTSFRGTISALEAPGAQAIKALKGLGLSADDVRKSIRERGLLATLQDLMDRTGGNIETLDLIIPNIRALIGVLSSAGSGASDYTAILGRMKTETGQTGDAFGVASETMAFKADQVSASFETVKISLGNMLLPMLKDLMDTIKGVVDSFLALDPSTQKMIVTFGVMAASAAPAMVAINKVGDAAKSLGGQFTQFSDMRAKGDSLFKSLSALKSIEFGVLIAGLTVIATFLGKVSEAAKKSNEDIIAMSRSGDALDRAAATVEILRNGQDRLRTTLDAVHQQIRVNSKGYEEYRASLEGTAQAAGYEINAAGDLVKVYSDWKGKQEAVVQAHYASTEATYKAAQAYADAEGELDRYDRAVAEGVAASTDMAAANKEVGMSAEEAAAGQRSLTEAVATMTAGYGGAVSKEMGDYNKKQSELKAKAAELAAEIKSLEATQGQQVTTSQKGALSANEVAAAQAKLGAVTEDLTNQTRKKNETDAEFSSRMAALQVQADNLSAKLGAGGMSTAIIDNSEKLADLKVKYDEATGAISANAAAHDEAMKRIVLDIAQQQLAQDGWTQTEIAAFTQVAQQMGVFDQASATLTADVLGATAKLAADGNAQAFAANLTNALTTAGNSTAVAAQQADTNMAGMAAAAVEHSSAAAAALGVVDSAAQTTASALLTLSSKEIAALPPVERAAYEKSLEEARQAAINTQIEMGKAMGSTALSPVDTSAFDASIGELPTKAKQAHDDAEAELAKPIYVMPPNVSAMQAANAMPKEVEGRESDAAKRVAESTKSISDSGKKALDAVGDVASKTADKVKATASQAKDSMIGFSRDTASAFAGVATSITNAFGLMSGTTVPAISEVAGLVASLPTFKEFIYKITVKGEIPDNLPGFQSGGVITTPAWVGEAGPELFFPTTGSGYVMNHSDSMRLTRAMEALAANAGRTGDVYHETRGGDTIIINDRAALALYYDQRRRARVDRSNALMGG